MPSDAVAQRHGCTHMRFCSGNGLSPGETHDAQEVGVSPGEMESAEDSAYIRPDSVTELPVYAWSVTGSLLFGSPLRRVRAYISRTCSLGTRRGLCLLKSGSAAVLCGGA